MFWLFNKPPPIEESHYVIIDCAGTFPIDKEYKELGVKEGWLIYDGTYRGINNELIYRYRMKE